ncbi:hypothetical protein [Okeania sp. KiyG1]|uniref:hypothetical protein n=1 Tax=Okeania sp. KiyG1 TaxID=2720165 RepID=UPI001922FC3F|nr:hypothetical protein [Okeania sp. KiyG1]
MLTINFLALVKRVYDINLNSLGVNPPLTPRPSPPNPPLAPPNPPLTPPVEGKGSQESVGKKEE